MPAPGGGDDLIMYLPQKFAVNTIFGAALAQNIPSDTNGCDLDTCQLVDPICEIEANPNPVVAGEEVAFSGSTHDWATFLYLNEQ